MPTGTTDICRTTIIFLAGSVVASCGEKAPPGPGADAFVRGLEAAGLSGVRYGGFRRDGRDFVLTGVSAVGAGTTVSASEVRFQGVASLEPLAVDRVVAVGVAAGDARAERVRLDGFRGIPGYLPLGAVAAEGYEGRLAGVPVRAASLARGASDALGGGARATFSGLRAELPGTLRAAAWDGSVEIAERGGPGEGAAVRLEAASAVTRVALTARLDGMPPGFGAVDRALWPFAVGGHAAWGEARLASLLLRAGPGEHAAPLRPGATPAEAGSALEAGRPVAATYGGRHGVLLREVPGLLGGGAVDGLVLRVADPEPPRP